MSTTLDSSFLRAVCLVSGFKGSAMVSCQAALLCIGLRGQTFTGADIPAELTSGSKHIAGCATGGLVAIGLLEVVGRVKSPNPDAKGRKLDLLQIPAPKYSTARAWLNAHGIEPPASRSDQLELLTA